MIISLIAAMDDNRGIGKDGMLPWKLPADLKRFKNLTNGHHVIMGRKTYESIGHLLPNRTMVIISKNSQLHYEGCLVVSSLSNALSIVEARGETEAFIIGGGQIFQQSIELADRMYLTLVHTVSETDTFFPTFDQSRWVLTESTIHPPDERNFLPLTFAIFEKIK